jgi:CHAD domain-containing protein
MTTRRQARTSDPQLAAGSQRVADAIRLQQVNLASAAGRSADPSVEDVHQGRVAARRLRSLLKTFGPLLDARWTRLYRIDLRSFARTFAAVREADVLSELLLGLARPDEGLQAAERQRLTAALEDRRTEARSSLRRHLGEPGSHALVKALAARANDPPKLARTDAAMVDVLTLVERSWRKAIRLLEKHPEAAAELHELRLALKHCRYALEAVADIEPKAAARLLRRLRTAQDRIGAHRDTVAATHWVLLNERTLGRMAMRRLTALLEAHETKLREDAIERSAKVLPAYERWIAAIRRLTKAARSDPA